MKFSSTYELLVFLRKEGVLTSFRYSIGHKSISLSLYGKRSKGGYLLEDLLSAEAYNQLDDALSEFCSGNVNEDGEFDSFDYDIEMDGDDDIMFSVQADVNSLFPEEMPLYDWLKGKDVWEIIGKYDDLIQSDDDDDFDDDDDDDENEVYDDYDPDYSIRVDDLSLEDSSEQDIIEKIDVYRYIRTTKKWELIENDEMKKDLFDHFCSAIRHGALESGTKNRITIDDRGIVRNEYTSFSYWDKYDLQGTFDDDVEYEIPDEKLQESGS